MNSFKVKVSETEISEVSPTSIGLNLTRVAESRFSSKVSLGWEFEGESVGASDIFTFLDMKADKKGIKARSDS